MRMHKNFWNEKLGHKKNNPEIKTSLCDFIYPVFGAPHKNHSNLIRAWYPLLQRK